LDYISGSDEVVEARLRVASVEAQLIIDNRWDVVTAVAKALMEHRTVSAAQVKEIILKFAIREAS
jgi:ATP-dependent Zn protease